VRKNYDALVEVLDGKAEEETFDMGGTITISTLGEREVQSAAEWQRQAKRSRRDGVITDSTDAVRSEASQSTGIRTRQNGDPAITDGSNEENSPEAKEKHHTDFSEEQLDV